MSKTDLIRAWKNPQFRAGLENVPANPAGTRLVEVDETSLQNVAGGVGGTVDRIPCGYICSVSYECWGFRCA